MSDFALWQASVINQIAFMLAENAETSLATTFFERHQRVAQTHWRDGEEALAVAIAIVNAERELAKILEEEKRERFARGNPEANFFESEAEFIEHWKQDCLDNGLI